MSVITLAQLTNILASVTASSLSDRPTTGQIFQLMYDTGLRVREVIEVERWTYTDADDFVVSLEKGEGTRTIPIALVPDNLTDRYIYRTPFTIQTYSSVNNTFKYYAPGLIFGEDSKRTTTHAYRYRYMKQLFEDGATIAEIAAIMGHINPANTAKYVTDAIYAGL